MYTLVPALEPSWSIPALITKNFRTAVQLLGSDLDFLDSEVFAQFLRAAGAIALLVDKVDTNIIQILGQWRSNEMFCYFHLTDEPIMNQFSAKILNADYEFETSQLVPCN